MRISFSGISTDPKGPLVLFVGSGGAPTEGVRQVDEAANDIASAAVRAAPNFEGNAREQLVIHAPHGLAASHLVLIGLGEEAALDQPGWQAIGGTIVEVLLAGGLSSARLHCAGIGGEQAASAVAQMAVGAQLRAYRFGKYKTRLDKPAVEVERLSLMTDSANAARRRHREASSVVDGVHFCRDLVTEPGNVLHPESYAEVCRSLVAEGLQVEILGERELRRLGMGALLAVGQGSSRETRLVVLRWNGAPKKSKAGTVAFVGKGVTFDTGGISLKPGPGMGDMKFDMGGSAVVCGLMKTLAARKALVNAVGVIGLAENMPSGDAQRPGDVITSMSGQTIEVLNTDAEGRLVLADALWYTADRFRPRVMVDLATLTGAMMIALGNEHCGFFSNDDALSAQLLAASETTGEKLWRMPLDPAHDKRIDSDIADMKNIAADRFAGATIGAQFLQRFIDETAWAHLDIAGVAWSTKGSATAPKGGTGFGVQLLDQFVRDRFE